MSAAAQVLSADVYEQPRAREYQEMQDIINRRGDHGRDRYGDLIDKEERVLDTVDRVVNDARLQRSERGSILHMSVAQIATRTAEVMYQVFRDALAARSTEDAKALLRSPERRLYLGIVLVTLALLAMLVTLGSGW